MHRCLRNGEGTTMEWSKEALEGLEKVPDFVRSMAKKAVEKHAKEKNTTDVSLEIFKEATDKYLSIIKKDDPNIEKIAVVRCNIVSEVCPGVGCLKAFNDRRLHFQEYDKKAQLIGFFTCGGCSGKRVGRLVDKLINYGLNTVHLSSCMLNDEEGTPKCPFKNQIKRSIEKKGIKVVEGTHH